MPETKEKPLTVAEIKEGVAQPQLVSSLQKYGTDLQVYVQIDEGEPQPLTKLVTQKFQPEGELQRVVLRMTLGAADKKAKEEPVTHTHAHTHGRTHDRE